MMAEDARTKLIEMLTDLVELRIPEEAEDALIAQINALSPDPHLLTYIYHPHVHFSDGHVPSIEEAVDKALSYRPIAL